MTREPIAVVTFVRLPEFGGKITARIRPDHQTRVKAYEEMPTDQLDQEAAFIARHVLGMPHDRFMRGHLACILAEMERRGKLETRYVWDERQGA